MIINICNLLYIPKIKKFLNKVLKLREIQSVDIRFSIAVNCIVFFINFDDCNIEDIKKILNKK